MARAQGDVPAADSLQVAAASADSGTARSAEASADSGAARPAEVPQRDIIDILSKLMGRKVEPTTTIQPKPGISITFFPSIGYNPSYGAFIGVSAALGGWTGDPATTTASKGAAGVSYSTTGQISVQFKTNIYTPGNRWVLAGDWRYLDTSQDTYGLGSADMGQRNYPMDFTLYRLDEVVFRRFEGTPWYAGPGVHFDDYSKIVDHRALAGERTPFSDYEGAGVTHTRSVGLSFNSLVDTRDNPINAQRGIQWAFGVRANLKALGGDTNWQSVTSDLRFYPKVPGGTLGLWSILEFSFARPPYMDLPAVGWDTYGRSGRGYLMGRIRGYDFVYQEVEYRATLTRNGLLGAVAFANVTSSRDEHRRVEHLNPGGGVGIRIKFDKRTRTNLGVDLASSPYYEGPQFFFGLQEVF